MGWSGEVLRLKGESDEDKMRRLQENIWETLYNYLRSRFTQPWHTDLLHSEYWWGDGVRREVEAVDGGWSIEWWFYDYGPQTLCMHWFDIAMSAQQHKVVESITRAGMELQREIASVEVARQVRYSIFLDTADELVQVPTDAYWYEERVMVTRDLNGRMDQVPLDDYPAEFRWRVHRALEAKRCECPVCLAFARKEGGPPR